MDAHPVVSRVWDIATPLVSDEGLEIVDIELHHEGRKGRVLRVYLDREDGTNIDDLTRVSRQLSDLLDVQDVLEGSYTLEVSSPGINRLLRKPAHFGRFVGKRVRVRTREKMNGRAAFLGTLKEATDAGIVVLQDNTEVYIPHRLIEKANYEHDWGATGKRKLEKVRRHAARSKSGH